MNFDIGCMAKSRKARQKVYSENVQINGKTAFVIINLNDNRLEQCSCLNCDKLAVSFFRFLLMK